MAPKTIRNEFCIHAAKKQLIDTVGKRQRNSRKEQSVIRLKLREKFARNAEVKGVAGDTENNDECFVYNR
jgi:hypothetical protein